MKSMLDDFDEERFVRTVGPFHVWRQYQHCSIDDATQHDALSDITDQFFPLLEDALARHDLHRILRLWVRAEKVIERYTSEQCDKLVPIHVQLQRTVWAMYRMVRRRLIRQILTCEDAEVPRLMAILKETVPIDFDEDWNVVERTRDGPKGAMYADLRAEMAQPLNIPPIATSFPATKPKH
jgi:hypothetical protein